MTRNSELVLVLRRTTRVLPSFLLLSTAGCLIAYFVFHVPLDELAVVVSVPLAVMFLIMRVLLVSIAGGETDTDRSAGPKRPLLTAAAGMAALGLLAGLGLFLSSGVYYAIGLTAQIVQGAFEIAAACLAFAIVMLIAVGATLFGADLELVVRRAAWDLLLYPTKIADRIFASHLRRTEHWS